MRVLAYVEDERWVRQIYGALDKIDYSEVYSMTIGKDNALNIVDKFVKVYFYDGLFNPYKARILLENILADYRPDIFISPSTNKGRAIAGIYVGLTGSSIATDVVDIKHGDGFIMTRLVYGGTGKASIRLDKPLAICISPGVFDSEPVRFEGELVRIDVDGDIVGEEFSPVEVTGNDPSRADILVVAGRGFRERGDLNMVMDLAGLLGGAWSVTRPLAADYGWADHWVGLSGLVVSPRIYIGIGVSGQPHHLMGARGAKIIIGINKDEDAPIFEEADYCIIGDLYRVLPALIERIRDRVSKGSK